MLKKILGLLMTILTACIVQAADLGAATLKYRLKWIYNASVIGDLYAERYGYFKAAGLDVKVKAGGPERDALRELELGYADFGVASADQVIRAVSKGAPLVVLAQIFQSNPLQWIYRCRKISFKGLDDLKGKTIGITFGKNDEAIMRALLAMGRIGTDQVKLFSVRLDYTPFFKGKVDLWPVYANTQAVVLQDKLAGAGQETALLDPGQFGVNFVANSIVTSARTYNKNPRLVKRFVKALVDGWQAALDMANQGKALRLLRQVDRYTSLNLLERQLEMTRRLVFPAAGGRLGHADPDGWRQTEQIMLRQGLIKTPVDIVSRLKPLP